MIIADYLKMARFFFLLALKRPPYRGHVQRNTTSAQGLTYDCFEPAGHCRSTIIALHGGTVNGKDDIRLQHLGRCLAACGATCIVPTLPKLSRFEWNFTDIDALVDLIRESTQDGVKVGLIGFSYGGSYALLAAADQRIANHIAFVLSFGAYYALDDLNRHQAAFGRIAPQQPDHWDNWLYLQLVMAKRNADKLYLSDQVRASLHNLLGRYCHAAELEEKKAFYQNHLNSDALVDFENSATNQMLLEQLSPKGRLSAIRCPVGLIHAQADTLVPVRHAFQIARELFSHNISHNILVSDLLDHVTLSNVFSICQWYRLATLLLPMVQHYPKEIP